MTFQTILKDTIELWCEGLITAEEAMRIIHKALIKHEETN
jgi:hypothetical protein